MSKATIFKHEFSTLPGSAPIEIDNSLPTECVLIRTEKYDFLIDFKTGNSKRTKRPTFEPIPSYGDLMTWTKFRKLVKEGAFIDYDGSGSLATATQVSDIDISPSRVRKTPPYPWVTHVLWCNR